MALLTYVDLQASVLDWLARPGDTLISGAVPDMVTMFEAEARAVLFNHFGEASTTLSTVAGADTVALPSDFGALRSIVLVQDPTRKLVYVTPDEMDSTYLTASTGTPEAYTIEGTNLRLADTPDSVYQIKIGYYQGIPALATASGGSNWLLAQYPSAYLFGTLAMAHAYIGNDERIPLWEQKTAEIFAMIQSADQKAKYGGGSLQIKTDTGNP